MNVLWITEHVKFENVVGYDMPSCWMRIFFFVLTVTMAKTTEDVCDTA